MAEMITNIQNINEEPKGELHFDYKDVRLLMKYVSERGKILPSRVCGLSFRKQKELCKAIKRARILALVPFLNDAR